MEKVLRKIQIMAPVENVVTKFKTSDGTEYDKQEHAELHEELLKKYPKLEKSDLEWVEGFWYSDYDGGERDFDGEGKKLEKALNSNKAIVFGSHSGGEEPWYEEVEPYLVAVEAVIKVLHRKTRGCNYNQYVGGVIYKKESLSFNSEKKLNGKGYYASEKGRHIKEVLK
jgi:hypothetical protein